MGNEAERRRLLIQALQAKTSDQACQRCLEQLDVYVSTQLAGEDYLSLYPEVALHLDLCTECAAAYARIYELELAEQQGRLPHPERIPAPDLSFLSAEIKPAGPARQDRATGVTFWDRLKEFLAPLDPANWQTRPAWQPALALAVVVLVVGVTTYMLLRPSDGDGTVAQVTIEPTATITVTADKTQPTTTAITPPPTGLAETAIAQGGPTETPTTDISIPAGSTPFQTNTPPPGCDFSVSPDLGETYQEAAGTLGCPDGNAGEVIIVQQAFENGRMLWREDTGKIFVLYNQGEWGQYDDTWQDPDPEYSCLDANTLAQTPPTPRRNFGLIWCTVDEVRQGLGNAIAAETQGSGLIQGFAGGLLLASGDQILALFSDGTWE